MNIKNLENINDELHVESLIETSRAVNHDLLGLVHVVDFCSDELSLLHSQEVDIYTDKISKSLIKIRSILNNHSHFLKSFAESSTEITSLHKAISKILNQLRISNRRVEKLVQYEFLKEDDFKDVKVQQKINTVIFSVLALALKFHFKGSREQKFKVVFSLDGHYFKINFFSEYIKCSMFDELTDPENVKSYNSREEHFFKKCNSRFGSSCLIMSDTAKSLEVIIDTIKFKE